MIHLKIVISESKMTTARLKQLWSIVSNTQSSVLLSLNDRDLNDFLLKKLELRDPLSSEENEIMNTYINSKISLIRDLAY